MSLIDQLKSKFKSFSSNGAKQETSEDSVVRHEMAEMGFLDHLEDLRWAILKGLGGVLVAMVVAVFFRGWIIEELLLGPKKADFFMYKILGINTTDFVLQNRTVTGQFFADIDVCLISNIRQKLSERLWIAIPISAPSILNACHSKRVIRLGRNWTRRTKQCRYTEDQQNVSIRSHIRIQKIILGAAQARSDRDF